MRVKRQVITHIIPAVLSLGWIAFIWSNSLKNAVDSGNSSSGVLKIVTELLRAMNIELLPTEAFIRKAAHFIEFAVLGCLLTLTVITLNLVYKRCFSALTCLLVACTDELLQLASPGRACRLTDVLIDFSGALVGILFICLINRLFARRLKKKSAHNTLKP